MDKAQLTRLKLLLSTITLLEAAADNLAKLHHPLVEAQIRELSEAMVGEVLQYEKGGRQP